jgi:membrane protease YdiL (CAAX protease family)
MFLRKKEEKKPEALASLPETADKPSLIVKNHPLKNPVSQFYEWGIAILNPSESIKQIGFGLTAIFSQSIFVPACSIAEYRFIYKFFPPPAPAPETNFDRIARKIFDEINSSNARITFKEALGLRPLWLYVPIAEEILFRGIILNTSCALLSEFNHNRKHPLKEEYVKAQAIILNGILFAAVHPQGARLSAMVTGCLYAGLTLFNHGSLVSAFTAHCGYNLMALTRNHETTTINVDAPGKTGKARGFRR